MLKPIPAGQQHLKNSSTTNLRHQHADHASATVFTPPTPAGKPVVDRTAVGSQILTFGAEERDREQEIGADSNEESIYKDGGDQRNAPDDESREDENESSGTGSPVDADDRRDIYSGSGSELSAANMMSASSSSASIAENGGDRSSSSTFSSHQMTNAVVSSTGGHVIEDLMHYRT